MQHQTPDRAMVEALEGRLRKAMLASDMEALDALLSDELVLVTQGGEVRGKADDLSAHRTGLLRLLQLELREPHIRLRPGLALVVTAAEVAGEFNGAPFNGRFRYSRTWAPEDGYWRVISAHCTEIGAEVG